MGLFKSFKEYVGSIINISDHIDVVAAERNIRNSIFFRGPNAWILAVAIIIASVGLNVNSIPVVIGAMLISPLMGPIFGLGLGLGVSDIDLMKSSGKNLFVMVSISLLVSFLYFLITPLSLSNPTELLARTSPTFYDVLIALFGGFAGIFEQCRKEKGTVFSGVAIATALMPPLCTAGFGLASGNYSYFLGALYLFVINCMFIMLATYVAVKYFKFRQTEFQDEKIGTKTKRITTLLIVIFIIPSIWSAVVLIKQNNFDVNATAFAEHSKAYGNSIIYDYKIDHTDGSKIELFFTGEPISDAYRRNLLENASRYGIAEESIIISEHAVSSNVNEIEMVKDIYEKMDAEITKRERDIQQLQERLSASMAKDIPYVQISREVASTYPTVEEIFIGQGASVLTGSYTLRNSTVVLVSADSLFTDDDEAKLKEWLMIRLDTDELELIRK